MCHGWLQGHKVRGLGGVLVAMLLWGCGEGGDNYPAREVPHELLRASRTLTAGAELFAKHCAFCHGHRAEGRSLRANDYDPPPMDFSSVRYREIDPAYLYWRIEQGKNVEPYRSRGSVMPAWGAHLSETEIWQLVRYLKSRAD